MRSWVLCLVGVLALGGAGLVSLAAATFAEESQFGQGHTIPVAWGDYDNDGDLDLAVGEFGQQNSLYINQGDGSFVREELFGTGSTFAVTWGDYDNDGDPDLAVANGNNETNTLYVNNGDGTFDAGSAFGAKRTNAAAWADYDLDGDLDLAIGNGLLGLDQQNQLFVNNGDGTFTRVAQFGSGQSASLVWGDCDLDGDPDVAVGNGGFGYEQQNQLYINNGDGTFTEQAAFGGGDTSCLVWGDYDNDGDLDLAVANWNAGQNYLYVNNGDGTFTEEPQFGTRDPNTLAWGDADNDGDLDLAVGNGDFSSADQNYLYLNNGDGTFTEQAEFGLGSTDALAWGDYDNDGDLDLATGNEHSPTQNYLYVNGENDGDFLILQLVGQRHNLGAGYSNRDGIGAKVAVYASGSLGDPEYLLGFREIAAHGGFAAQNAVAGHFGLPGAAIVDVRITWPGSDETHSVQDLPGLSVGQRLTVVEESVQGIDGDNHGPLDGGILFRAVPNPTSGATRLAWARELGCGGSAGEGGFAIIGPSGRIVRILVARADARGGYRAHWDGRTNTGALAPAGIYLVRGPRGYAGASGKLMVVH
ncbi:MAG: CRTAC1 family protein [Candidatus Eisenbacteria sp.]|nr:CRTAC1 family protein [Candidatus Eisenbacteria bacterium]